MIRIERKRCGGEIIASLGVAKEMFGPLCNPFYRTLELLCRNGGERVFAIRKQLGSESATDIGRYDAQLVRRDPEHHLAQQVAQEMRALAPKRQREAVRLLIVFRDHGSGIKIVGDEPLIDDG